MRIIDLLDKKSINLNLKSTDKTSVINELVDLVDASGNLNDKNEYKPQELGKELQSLTQKQKLLRKLALRLELVKLE